MRHLRLIGVLFVLFSISSYTEGAQDSYTILLLDFEDQSGLQNPLLSKFLDTIAFVLSKQTGSVQVRLIPKAERDAFLNRAKDALASR